ncbi:MAG: tetratricopeptide repeat protein [Prevotella sp.]|nr:tetratricopeptide repeat protein [Prevotella sp.]
MAETKEIANFLQLAHDAVSEKDYDVATDHLISVLQIDSRNSEAIGLMGDVAFYRKDLDTAEGYYLRRVELSPESYEAHKDLGRLYMERCEYENATREFEIALKYDNDHSDPYLYLASMYYNQGKYDEAYDWLYRLVFEVKTEQSQSDRDLYNQAYYGVSYTISQNKSVSELDGLIEQLEAKYNVSITTHLVVNPDAPLMPFRKTDERSYEIDYDLDSGDKFYEVLSSLLLLDNHLGGEHFDFHHFLIPTDEGREQFEAMTRNTMDADSTLSMVDLLNYLVVDIRTSLIRIYTDEVMHITPEFKKYRPVRWLGMGNAIAQSYGYITKLERIHAPRWVVYTHKVLLYLKSVQLFEYFKACDKRIDFTSQLVEHKMGCAIYNEHINMKNQAKRRDWMAFYKSFINQICPVLRYYVKLEKI